ncbi:MAG: class I SAM-dependent methyltransferase, partial [Gemmatimonadota bacterium]
MRVGQARAVVEARSDGGAGAGGPHGSVRWVAADALMLPFPDAAFDRVLIGYGLRNFGALEACLGEILRCLRTGGKLVALDFGHPRSSLLRRLYLGYLDLSTRVVGWTLHRNPEAYVYIPESLRQYPGQREVLRTMERTGYVRCGFVDFLFGAMAIVYGERPAGAETRGER